MFALLSEREKHVSMTVLLTRLLISLIFVYNPENCQSIQFDVVLKTTILPFIYLPMSIVISYF